jgi:hypothetical protein
MEITVKCQYFNNMQSITNALVKEGYSVKIEPVMKSKQLDSDVDYYNVTFSNGISDNEY